MSLQDLLNALVLSEGAYKAVDHGSRIAAELVSRVVAGFPPGYITLQRLQWSSPSVRHRQGSLLL